MFKVLVRGFQGLSPRVYLRHFLFGLIFPAVIYFTIGSQHFGIGIWLMWTANVFLYPFSRFVYDALAGFIAGDNIFIVPFVLALVWNVFTMMICWSFAILVAPLALLYFHLRSDAGAGGS